MVGWGLSLYEGMGVIWYGTFQPYICATELACEYSRLSPMLADGDVSRFSPPPRKISTGEERGHMVVFAGY